MYHVHVFFYSFVAACSKDNDCGNHICHEGYCSKLPIYLQNILDSYDTDVNKNITCYSL